MSSFGPVGMVPSKPVGLFVLSMVMSVGGVEALPRSTFPVSMVEAAVALLPSAGFTITLWEREEAAYVWAYARRFRFAESLPCHLPVTSRHPKKQPSYEGRYTVTH